MAENNAKNIKNRLKNIAGKEEKEAEELRLYDRRLKSILDLVKEEFEMMSHGSVLTR